MGDHAPALHGGCRCGARALVRGDEAAALRGNVHAIHHRCPRQLALVQLQTRHVDRAGIDEGVTRHCGHGILTGAVLVAVVDRPAGRIVVVDVGDVGVVDDCGVAHVHVGEVVARRLVPGHVNLTRTKWEPANRAAAGDADAPVAAAHKGDQRRCIDRTHVAWARHPAPAVVDVCPAAIMERCKAPGSTVNPGPAPWVDPGPAAAAVRCPACVHARREPDVAVGVDAAP